MVSVCIYVISVWLTSMALQARGQLDEPLSAPRNMMYKLKEKIRSHKAVQGLLCPAPDDNETHIKLEIWPFSVLRFDEIEQSIITLNAVQMFWRDKDLAWNESDYNGINTVTINYNELWHPMIVIVNAAQEENIVLDSPMSRVVLFSNGTFMLFTAAYIKTTCNLDLTYYPFNKQECDILFMLFYDECRLNLSSNMLPLPDPYRLNGEWAIIDRHIVQSTYSAPTGVLPIVNFKIKLERNSLYYTVSVVMPLLLSSVMSSLVFWIPPSTGEKISFLVSVFISNSVFLSSVVTTMPRSLSDMPRLVLFLSVLTVESILALLATLFVIRRFSQEEKEAHVWGNVTQEVTTLKDEMGGEIKAGSSVKTNRPKSGSAGVKKNYVTPFKAFGGKPQIYDTSRTRGSWYITSRQWDVIFFVLYNCTSLPCYIGLSFL